ncbi:MAG TPA: IclR family transcriptional regulator [Novosphingobium sp.]
MRSSDEAERTDAGPRAILRVPDVLMAVAGQPEGVSLATLAQELDLPKTSLHRLLRTLEHGGYLLRREGRYLPGAESFRLASRIAQAAPRADFPACARPTIEALARETGETVMLGVLSDQGGEIVYVDVVDSDAPLRFTVRTGNRRPLYSVASGKAVLAFLSPEAQAAYLDQAEFVRFTGDTTGRDEMPGLLAKARREAMVFDQNGIVDGAAGIAAPAFGRSGEVVCAVSVAGPTDRIRANLADLESRVRAAAEQISRLLGFDGAYPRP